MAEFWKTFADVWPALKDAIRTAVDYLGFSGALGFAIAIWREIENRALRRRVEELSDKLIETGDRSTARLTDIANERADVLGQLEALSGIIEKNAPKGRGR
ncbi:hypothetical protein [Hansschlegelia plantiphila]|uniref:Uncharacterized protein n=1 Tax=Hansschlegelia plantiphila TaxID=374655 RepID=A0A9W6IZL4_9HYPH|nr:hypothetical protein [Hansschlegelia plantiphila]GLK66993.1 hypothetical protein GCM10008179_06310 [Hansschlegelia plantiphila]